MVSVGKATVALPRGIRSEASSQGRDLGPGAQDAANSSEPITGVRMNARQIEASETPFLVMDLVGSP